MKLVLESLKRIKLKFVLDVYFNDAEITNCSIILFFDMNTSLMNHLVLAIAFYYYIKPSQSFVYYSYAMPSKNL